MKVKVEEEHGYNLAIKGMSYSHLDTREDIDSWWESQKLKAENRAGKLAPKDGGHNKFLESIVIWVDVEASRAFWQEFDTYRVGITKQSTSTMHKLSKRRPVAEDFEEETPEVIIEAFAAVWDSNPGIIVLKHALPEGYLQRRLVVINYKSLRNMYFQRVKHRYHYWQTFCKEMLSQIEHPRLIYNTPEETLEVVTNTLGAPDL